MLSLLTSSYTPAPLKFRVIFLGNICSIELLCKFEVKWSFVIWQDLETRKKFTDLTMLFKIKTGNVRVSFPNDLRKVDCPSWPGLVHSTHSSSSIVRLSLTRTRIPYVLIESLHSIQVFAMILSIDDFFSWLSENQQFIYLFVFILFIYFTVNVMSFIVPTFHCKISSLEAIMSIKD